MTGFSLIFMCAVKYQAWAHHSEQCEATVSGPNMLTLQRGCETPLHTLVQHPPLQGDVDSDVTAT